MRQQEVTVEDKAKDSFLVDLWATVFKCLSLVSLFRLVKRRVLARSSFRASHCRDFANIARRIRDKADSVSSFLGGYLEEKERGILRESDLSKQPPRQVRRLVLKCLNAALGDDRLFSPDRFEENALPEDLKSSLAQPSYIRRAREINRRLLEISYPHEIEKISAIAYRFVDFWVLGNLIASIMALLSLYFLRNQLPLSRPAEIFSLVVVCYGLYRAFEIVIHQADILLFAHYRATQAGQPYLLRGYRRIVLALLHNYAEIVFWFATAYVFFSHEVAEEQRPASLPEVLTGSLLQMLGEPVFELAAGASLLPFIVLVQTGVGLFMTTLSLARFIGLIPTPGSMDRFEMEQLRESIAEEVSKLHRQELTSTARRPHNTGAAPDD